MDNENTLIIDNEKYKQFINDKEKNSVFLLATVRIKAFKNIFKILKNVFKSVTLKICSIGIGIHECEWSKTSKVKADEISALFYCNNTIYAKFDTSELERINKDITDDCFLYMFINKDNYNTETNIASSIQFYIIKHINDDMNLILIEKIINCKQ